MQKTQTTCLIILTTIAVGASLYFLSSVLLPFIIALFVVIGCRPILEFLQNRLNLNRFLAFGVTFLTGFALVAGLGIMVWASINDLSKHPEAYEKRLNSIANRIAFLLQEHLGGRTGKRGEYSPLQWAFPSYANATFQGGRNSPDKCWPASRRKRIRATYCRPRRQLARNVRRGCSDGSSR